MQPASPSNGMNGLNTQSSGGLSPGGVFNNHVNDNRVHFYYNGVDDSDSKRLYNQFYRLRKRCQRKDFGEKFGSLSSTSATFRSPKDATI